MILIKSAASPPTEKKYDQSQVLKFINILEQKQSRYLNVNENKIILTYLSQCPLFKDMPNRHIIAKSLIQHGQYIRIDKGDKLPNSDKQTISFVISGKLDTQAIQAQRNSNITNLQSTLKSKKSHRMSFQAVCGLIEQTESSIAYSNDIICVVPYINNICGNSNMIKNIKFQQFQQKPKIFTIHQPFNFTGFEDIDEQNDNTHNMNDFYMRASTTCSIIQFELKYFLAHFDVFLKQILFISQSLLQTSYYFSYKNASLLSTKFKEQYYFTKNNIDLIGDILIIKQGQLQLLRNGQNVTIGQGQIVGLEFYDNKCVYEINTISIPLICYVLNKQQFQFMNQANTTSQQMSQQNSKEIINNSQLNESITNSQNNSQTIYNKQFFNSRELIYNDGSKIQNIQDSIVKNQQNKSSSLDISLSNINQINNQKSVVDKNKLQYQLNLTQSKQTSKQNSVYYQSAYSKFPYSKNQSNPKKQSQNQNSEEKQARSQSFCNKSNDSVDSEIGLIQNKSIQNQLKQNELLQHSNHVIIEESTPQKTQENQQSTQEFNTCVDYYNFIKRPIKSAYYRKETEFQESINLLHNNKDDNYENKNNISGNININNNKITNINRNRNGSLQRRKISIQTRKTSSNWNNSNNFIQSKQSIQYEQLEENSNYQKYSDSIDNKTGTEFTINDTIQIQKQINSQLSNRSFQSTPVKVLQNRPGSLTERILENKMNKQSQLKVTIASFKSRNKSISLRNQNLSCEPRADSSCQNISQNIIENTKINLIDKISKRSHKTSIDNHSLQTTGYLKNNENTSKDRLKQIQKYDIRNNHFKNLNISSQSIQFDESPLSNNNQNISNYHKDNSSNTSEEETVTNEDYIQLQQKYENSCKKDFKLRSLSSTAVFNQRQQFKVNESKYPKLKKNVNEYKDIQQEIEWENQKQKIIDNLINQKVDQTEIDKYYQQNNHQLSFMTNIKSMQSQQKQTQSPFELNIFSFILQNSIENSPIQNDNKEKQSLQKKEKFENQGVKSQLSYHINSLNFDVSQISHVNQIQLTQNKMYSTNPNFNPMNSSFYDTKNNFKNTKMDQTLNQNMNFTSLQQNQSNSNNNSIFTLDSQSKFRDTFHLNQKSLIKNIGISQNPEIIIKNSYNPSRKQRFLVKRKKDNNLSFDYEIQNL